LHEDSFQQPRIQRKREELSLYYLFIS